MEEANLKGYILCDSNYMTFGKTKQGDGKKISGCHGLVKKQRWVDGIQRIFRTVKFLCMIL